MTRTPVLHRFALALALALAFPAASLVAIAGEPVETTEIEITVNGITETVSIDDLKVGQTRQLYSEAGTLVTATRTAESLELDIAGDKTSIRMIDPAGIDDSELSALIEAHAGAADGKQRVVRVHRVATDGADGPEVHVDGKRKVIVLKGDSDSLDAHDVEVLVKNHGDAGSGGKKVVVKRKLISAEDAEVK